MFQETKEHLEDLILLLPYKKEKMFNNSIKYNGMNCLINMRRTKEVLEEFHKYLKYGEKDLILDMGSGTGNITVDVLLPFIPHPNFRLIGVDISKNYIDFANDYVKDPRVSFRLMDITEKNKEQLKSVFEGEEVNPGFDKVFSFSVINWTYNHEQCFKNIYTLLRPGGQLLTWFWGYTTLSDIWHRMCTMEKWLPYMKDEPVIRFPFHNSTDPVADCTDMLNRIGFQDIICDCVRKPQVQDLSIPWDKILPEIDPHVHTIPDHLLTEYMDDFMRMFYHYIDKTNGMPFDRIVVIATKPLA